MSNDDFPEPTPSSGDSEYQAGDSDEDIKPKTKKPTAGSAKGSPAKKAKTAVSPRTPGGGDKFVTTPAIRQAIIEEILSHVPTSKLDFSKIAEKSGGDSKKIAKYYSQTFRKHLMTSVGSSSFGAGKA